MTPEAFFKYIEQSDIPIVVDVWAPWCGPCRRMEPILNEIGEQYEGRVEVYKLNADESQPIVKALGVLGLPTTIVYRNGEELGRRTGALGRADLAGIFEAALSEDVTTIPGMSRNARLFRLALACIVLFFAIVLHGGWLAFVISGLLFFLALNDKIAPWRTFKNWIVRKVVALSQKYQ